jgi:hypothetical protein
MDFSSRNVFQNYKIFKVLFYLKLLFTQMNQIQMMEDAKSNEKSIIKELREEIGVLKKWKETAIIETVDKDR